MHPHQRPQQIRAYRYLTWFQNEQRRIAQANRDLLTPLSASGTQIFLFQAPDEGRVGTYFSFYGSACLIPVTDFAEVRRIQVIKTNRFGATRTIDDSALLTWAEFSSHFQQCLFPLKVEHAEFQVFGMNDLKGIERKMNQLEYNQRKGVELGTPISLNRFKRLLKNEI